ncbi:MAG: hypothetical protein ABSD59_16260 [Terracidiphilus sp.]
MQAALRPMNLGEILDRMFEIYRKQFLLFAGIAALPAAAMLGIHLVDIAWVHSSSLVHPFRQPGIVLWRFAVGLGYYHISFFLQFLYLPAFVRAVSCDVFGDRTTIVASLRFAIARWRGYLWLAVLKLAAVLIVPEVLMFAVFWGIGTLEDKLGLLNDTPSAFAIVALLSPILAGTALFLWAGACFSLVFPAAVAERLTGFKALSRSWRLSRNSRWRIFITWLLIAVCSWVLSAAVSSLLRWVAYFCYYDWHLYWFNLILSQQLTYILFAAISIVIGPLYPIAVTLLYYDQRSRKEGFDVELMMEAAGLGNGESGAIPLLRGGGEEFEGAVEPLWTRTVKFVRSLRGFD